MVSYNSPDLGLVHRVFYMDGSYLVYQNLYVWSNHQLPPGLLPKLITKVKNKDNNIHKQLSSKKSELYLNEGPRKSRFSLNLTDIQTYGRTDISIYGVVSLLITKSSFFTKYIPNSLIISNIERAYTHFYRLVHNITMNTHRYIQQTFY